MFNVSFQFVNSAVMPESTVSAGSQSSGLNASNRAAAASRRSSAASAVIQKQHDQPGARGEVQPSSSISDSFASRMQDSAYTRSPRSFGKM